MPMLADLPKAIAVYRNGRMSLDQFEDWFRTNSRGMFGESPEVLEACLSIDAAFSELRYGVMTKQAFDQELANAVRPFEPRVSHVWWEVPGGHQVNMDTSVLVFAKKAAASEGAFDDATSVTAGHVHALAV